MRNQRMTVLIEVPEDWSLPTVMHELNHVLFMAKSEIRVLEIHPGDLVTPED